MDKARLIKLMRRKVYWERERDKCFLHVFTSLAGLSIKLVNHSGIKKIGEIGWSNAGWWNKIDYFFDLFFLIFMLFYLLVAIHYLTRIQICSQKLVHLNQFLLEELNNLSDTDIKVK